MKSEIVHLFSVCISMWCGEKNEEMNERTRKLPNIEPRAHWMSEKRNFISGKREEIHDFASRSISHWTKKKLLKQKIVRVQCTHWFIRKSTVIFNVALTSSKHFSSISLWNFNGQRKNECNLNSSFGIMLNNEEMFSLKTCSWNEC